MEANAFGGIERLCQRRTSLLPGRPLRENTSPLGHAHHGGEGHDGRLGLRQTEHDGRRPRIDAREPGKELEDLLLDSIGTFFVLFRAVHRLTGQVPPQTPKALVSETAEVAGLEGAAFDWVLDKLVGHNVPALKPYDPIGDRYLEQIERLVQFVDQYDPERPAPTPGEESKG